MSDSEKNLEGFHINIKLLHTENVLKMNTAANHQGLNSTTCIIEFHSSFILLNSSFHAPHNKVTEPTPSPPLHSSRIPLF